MPTTKVNCTKNYRLFERSPDNRPVNLRKHKNLRASLQKHGWLRSKPMACRRSDAGRLIVMDGQHRLALAEELGIAVWWVEEVVDFCVAEVNRTIVKWVPRDHAEKHAANGLREYQYGLEFADKYKLSVGLAFALLSGTTTFSNVSDSVYGGSFRPRDKTWAESVASLYSSLCALSPRIRNMRLMEACMALCRVESFDPARLIAGAERCRDKLVPYSTRDAYLEMLEVVYNFGRKSLVPLKLPAIETMRRRNAITASVAKKKQDQKSQARQEPTS